MGCLFVLVPIAFAGVATADPPGFSKPAPPLNLQLPAQPAAPHQWSPPEIQQAAVKISAEDLTVAFALNEMAAQQRFAKLSLHVEGTVWAHSQKADFLTYVVLYGHPRKTYDAEESYCWLICLLPKSLAEASAELKAGDNVQIVGSCQGLIPSQGIRVLFCGHHLSRTK